MKSSFFEKIVSRWNALFRKHRFVMQDATTQNEQWHIHLSPAAILTTSLSALLLLFVVVLMLVAYTPVMEFLPGFRTDADRQRESLTNSIMRLDSMERVMNAMMTYNENISMIMAGKTPVARTIVRSDSTRRKPVLVVPSVEDSLLRAQMEGDGIYSLNREDAARTVREAVELITPVEGLITRPFNLEEGHFGVAIAAASKERVTAIDNGTVIASLWTPEGGQQLIIQHRGNLTAIYRNLSQPNVETNQTVRAGEIVGYTADKQSEEDEAKEFELELWMNGKPVNPEGYILF